MTKYSFARKIIIYGQLTLSWFSKNSILLKLDVKISNSSIHSRISVRGNIISFFFIEFSALIMISFSIFLSPAFLFSNSSINFFIPSLPSFLFSFSRFSSSTLFSFSRFSSSFLFSIFSSLDKIGASYLFITSP